MSKKIGPSDQNKHFPISINWTKSRLLNAKIGVIKYGNEIYNPFLSIDNKILFMPVLGPVMIF